MNCWTPCRNLKSHTGKVCTHFFKWSLCHTLPISQVSKEYRYSQPAIKSHWNLHTHTKTQIWSMFLMMTWSINDTWVPLNRVLLNLKGGPHIQTYRFLQWQPKHLCNQKSEKTLDLRWWRICLEMGVDLFFEVKNFWNCLHTLRNWKKTLILRGWRVCLGMGVSLFFEVKDFWNCLHTLRNWKTV